MFNRDRVQFTEEDLNAGQALDEIYEALKDASGFDFIVLAAQIANIQEVVAYLMDGDRENLANRLFGLGAMFVRDNVDLSALGDDTVESV